jgi:hypothetical protein
MRPEPSPGPWTVEQRNVRLRHHAAGVWVVLDRDGKTIAECRHEHDARWFAENSPEGTS